MEGTVTPKPLVCTLERMTTGYPDRINGRDPAEMRARRQACRKSKRALLPSPKLPLTLLPSNRYTTGQKALPLPHWCDHPLAMLLRGRAQTNRMGYRPLGGGNQMVGFLSIVQERTCIDRGRVIARRIGSYPAGRPITVGRIGLDGARPGLAQ